MTGGRTGHGTQGDDEYISHNVFLRWYTNEPMAPWKLGTGVFGYASAGGGEREKRLG